MSPRYIAKVRAFVNDEDRLFLILAGNAERVVYDVEFPYDRAGNLTAQPRANLCMTADGFARRTGWRA